MTKAMSNTYSSIKETALQIDHEGFNDKGQIEMTTIERRMDFDGPALFEVKYTIMKNGKLRFDGAEWSGSVTA